MTSFTDLKLDAALLNALEAKGYLEPTPIQAQSIPHLLEGRDLLGCARTGTGKTAAFALPILQRLKGRSGQGVRALVLVPTRELAAQVAQSFRTYGEDTGLGVAVVYGGVAQGQQVKSLARASVLVATPGRLVDLMNQGKVKLGHVEVLVLDEADHMLDLGFLPDVKKIIAAVPKQRQTLLFSATMPKEIQELANALLRDPVTVMVTPPATTLELVDQSVFLVPRLLKPGVLVKILQQPGVESALVFARTKRGADRIAKRLAASRIPVAAIHGNKAQNLRERTLKSFRDGRVRVLVATDIAARGLDITGISHVVNYELPNVPETYVHRIGRTGRAGAKGIAISLCSEDEREYLKDIEKLTRVRIRVATEADIAPPGPPGARPRPQEIPRAGVPEATRYPQTRKAGPKPREREPAHDAKPQHAPPQHAPPPRATHVPAPRPVETPRATHAARPGAPPPRAAAVAAPMPRVKEHAPGSRRVRDVVASPPAPRREVARQAPPATPVARDRTQQILDEFVDGDT